MKDSPGSGGIVVMDPRVPQGSLPPTRGSGPSGLGGRGQAAALAAIHGSDAHATWRRLGTGWLDEVPTPQ